MKKLLCAILAASLLLSLSAASLADKDLDDVAITLDGGCVYFDRATGTITDADETLFTADIPAELANLPVKGIAANAFAGCSILVRVTVPEGVTFIGDGAFEGCTSLLAVSIPGSVVSIGSRAFAGCTSLTGISIPQGVKTVGDSAFESCQALVSASLPASVTSVGSRAFAECASLTGITFPGAAASVEPGTFYECGALKNVTLSPGVASIGEDAFYACFSLASVTIPDSVRTIGSGAFDYCVRLSAVTLPLTTEYNALAFDSATSLYRADGRKIEVIPVQLEGGTAQFNTDLQEIFGAEPTVTRADIPASVNGVAVKRIGERAFYGFPSGSALTAVTVPEGVTEIGSEAFSGCGGLTSVSLPSTLTSIGDGAFSGCVSLASVALPDGLTSIGDSAFMMCSALGSAAIPAGVTSVGDQTFLDCTALSRVTLPDGLTSVGRYAFSNTALTAVNVPAGVSFVGDGAFTRCSSLGDIYFAGTGSQWSAAATAGLKAFRAMFPGETPVEAVDPDKTAVHSQAVAFTDMAGHWGKEAADFMSSRGYMNGTGDGTVFSPEQNMSYGMALTILARLTRVDTTASDVWDKVGMEWGSAAGLNPYGKASTDTVERQVLIWMLWKIDFCPDANISVLNGFPDAASIGAEYRTAMAWAVQEGITTGTDKGIEPAKETSRAEFAAFVMRAYELF